MKIRELFSGDLEHVNGEVEIKGWVRSHQNHKNISFINVNDGSTFRNMQVVYKGMLKDIGIGSAVIVRGVFRESKREEQKYEIECREIEVVKEVSDFMIQKNEHSFEFLRENAHVRHRTSVFLCVNHIRNMLYKYVNDFFGEEGFVWIQAPIITENNCEGGADIFSIEDSDEYFNKKALLSVSGQFHAEACALGLGKVYTFGPTFRSEKSNTSRHLSEFWMIEPEMSFCDLEECVGLMEKFLKYVVTKVLENGRDELVYLQGKLKENEDLIEKLKKVVKDEFGRVEYVRAVKILREEGLEIQDGDDLNSEQEKYLVEKFGKPVFVMNYPKKIKAFYMKSAGGDKVRSIDLLVPGIGELMGGSERISDGGELVENLREFGISGEELKWYVDLREMGYYSSSGFGIGFERLVCYVTGLKNVKDAISFPRSYRQLKY